MEWWHGVGPAHVRPHLPIDPSTLRLAHENALTFSRRERVSADDRYVSDDDLSAAEGVLPSAAEGASAFSDGLPSPDGARETPFAAVEERLSVE